MVSEKSSQINGGLQGNFSRIRLKVIPRSTFSTFTADTSSAAGGVEDSGEAAPVEWGCSSSGLDPQNEIGRAS
jgi:hypothetical protein